MNKYADIVKNNLETLITVYVKLKVYQYFS